MEALSYDIIIDDMTNLAINQGNNGLDVISVRSVSLEAHEWMGNEDFWMGNKGVHLVNAKDQGVPFPSVFRRDLKEFIAIAEEEGFLVVWESDNNQ